MPEWWSWTVTALVVIVIGLLTPLAWMVARRRWLSTRGWTFDCSLRQPDALPGRGWMLGVARYSGETVEWYRVYSWSLVPRVRLTRGATHVSSTREPEASEAGLLYEDQRIAELAGVHEGVCLAMSRQDMTAFLSWMEAALPGQQFRS